MIGGAERQANLTILCDKAAKYEATGNGGLHGFLQYMKELSTVGGDSESAKMVGESEDLVRIMTMHKSKGLEFPAVILLGLERKGKKHGAGLRFHPALGIDLPYFNTELNIRRASHRADAFSKQIEADERAERCRLLYVAMTRAREKLIMVCCEDKDLVKKLPLWSRKPSSSRIVVEPVMSDWVMECVNDETQGKAVAMIKADNEDRQESFPQFSTGYQQDGSPYAITVCTPFVEEAVENVDKL